ncbi:hypothetical protein [Phycicoccus duodecadis]|uniref:Tetratricopeptide repeat protein n=1 Tax=Phycicoccus duodecadis TaxID=173053 RepID=A0A2N3YMZ6_9MICO|nr:hypothetical protein [Phycicoccus duodecadis]PKW28213.1 hypothetical protein ATL31_3071 [Phycicoccus duodecadis]
MQWDLVSPEFADVSLAADREPPGPARVRGHQAALRLAQRHGSFAEEYVARTDLSAALFHVPDSPEMLTHVAWLRGALGAEHGLVQAERDDVLWKLKWAVEKIEKLPEVPLAAWRAAVDDLAEAFTGDGYHLRPVHAARAWLAVALDEPAERDAELARWLETPRDGRSDCAACEARGQALLALESDPHRALEVLARVVSGGMTCAEEPQVSQSHDAEIRSGLGDLDGAAASFRRSWYDVADDVALADTVARCLRVLVRMGNTDRAYDLLLPRLGWLDELHTAADRMWFAGTAAWVLHHARRLGLAADEIGGRPIVEVQDELARVAEDLAARFDARSGTVVTSRRLLAACSDALVADGPTLPPTHLTSVPTDAGRSAPAPTTGADVVALAEGVRDAQRAVDPALETALRGWLAARERVLPGLEDGDDAAALAAASTLDRVSAHLLRDPEREAERLRLAERLARRAGDEGALRHARGDLAVLAVRAALDAHGPGSPEARAARDEAESLAAGAEADGHAEVAAALWRWYALTTRPADAVARLRHAASLYAGLGLAPRQALCLLDAAPLAYDGGPAGPTALVEEAERLVGAHPVLRGQALDLRARMARAAGDLDRAADLHEQALAAVGSADGPRLAVLLPYCDLLVDLSAWERLEPRAADAVAVSARLRDPVALAVAQRHLGLAWVETGRPAEAAELLEAALPLIHQHVPDLVGPTAWALGNADSALGTWRGARTAFATASAGFEAAGRLEEASHAQYRAGMAAWEADELEAAAAHLDDAVDKARAGGTTDVVFAAARSRAALQASGEDLDAGITALDAVLGDVERFDREHPADDPDAAFDPEVHEPDILRQGAHLLARRGRTDDAVARLARAEALVGGDFERVLRAEAGAVLADADRLEEAEPRLRASLTELHAHGLHRERVEAAGALARALDRAGRPEEARDVWDAFGPGA